jgi:hypothetical protein
MLGWRRQQPARWSDETPREASAEMSHGRARMTGKNVVCSPRRCVGKTLISRLLIEFYVVKDRSVVAFDLADEGPQLTDYLPKIAAIADIGDVRGQMALFDRLIGEKDIPTVIDVSHRAFRNFFTIARDISFFEEAHRRSITPLILFIIDPSVVSTEAYAMLRREFVEASLLPVRNQIEAVHCVVPPSGSTLPSSLDVPVLGFSLRALIDQQSFSFSQFWQATPTAMSRAGNDQLRGWLEYIFFQFRHLEFSLGHEEPSAVIVDGSRQPHTAPSQRAIGISEQVLYHPPKQQRRDDNPIDQFGSVIVAMLQKAAEVSSDNCARSKVIADELSLQLRATEDRINALETEIEHFRNRALRAETCLQRIQREIEEKLFAPADAVRNTVTG